MTETDGFFLPRHEQTELLEILATIPDVVDDLIVAIARQDRTTRVTVRIATGSDEQPLPYNAAASEVADDLHGTLAAWVRHVCEQRALDYRGRDDTTTLARWLTRWIVALAMSEGAEESLDEIRCAVRRARAVCDSPREKISIRPPEESLEAVGLTKAELREAIWIRRERRIPRQTINAWIDRGKLSSIDGEHYLLTDALKIVDEIA